MLQIDDYLISFDVIEEYFACDLDKCFGLCCYEGESGAPLLKSEIAIIENVFEKIKKNLPDTSLDVIRKVGFFEVDAEGDFVTPCVNGKECVYAVKDGKTYKCAFEIAYEKGEIDFKKPVSCHLFPVRVKKYVDFTAVNLVKVGICKAGFIKGKLQKIKAYEFLKEAIIRYFGKEFYEKLDYAAKNLKIEKITDDENDLPDSD